MDKSENGIEYASKDDRVKEKVVYKVVPVPYYYPVPVDAEWYYKHYEPPMRNGGERGYHGYEDPAFDHFPFPPPPLHGFPAPPRARDFHYYPAGGREDMERYWRPVSPLYRNMSPGRSEFSPPSGDRKQPKENGEYQRNTNENGEKKDKHANSSNNNNNTSGEATEENQAKSKTDGSEEAQMEMRSVKSEGNESETAEENHDENNSTNSGSKRDDIPEESCASPDSNNHKQNESESNNRKRKRYMMTFPYDQRKKTKEPLPGGGEVGCKEEKNNNTIDSVEDVSMSDHTPDNRRMRNGDFINSEERERVYLKQKSYPSNGGGPNGHYPPYMVMRSPPYMGSDPGRSPRYATERSHSMYETSRRYEENMKDLDTPVRISECDDDKKEIRYHPNGRRARTVFTRQQLLTLNNVFDKHPFVSGERMSELSDQLGLDRKIVKIWFQNKRQYARKKGSLVERNEEYYYDYQDRYNPSSAPPTMASERWQSSN